MAININGTGSITGLSSISSPTISGGSVPLGDATAPGIVFSGDPNTGIYSPGADQVAISTNSTGRLFVNSSGSVGIGTSSASTNVEINAALDTGASLGLNEGQLSIGREANSGGAIRIGYDTTNNFGFISSGRVGTSWDRLILNAGGGNVGIGTTSVNFGAIDHGVHIYGSGAQEGIRLETTNGSGGILEIYAENGGNTLDTRGSGYIRFNNAASEWGRWDSSGRLLVGTASSAGGSGSTQYATIQVRGNSGSSSEAGLISLQRGETGPNVGNGEALGAVLFASSDGAEFASIIARGDGTTGSNDYPGRIEFSTTADGASSPTERMRISSDGLVRTYGDGNSIIAASAQAAGTTFATFICRHSASSTTTGTTSFQVMTNGNAQNTNNSYGAISDIKLKENIVDASSQWSDIKALQVRKYNFKEGQTHTQIGLVAQEVELVSPGLVTESPDRDAEGNDLGTTTKSVNYSVLYMKAVKALQEAMERIEQLEAKVAALEAA